MRQILPNAGKNTEAEKYLLKQQQKSVLGLVNKHNSQNIVQKPNGLQDKRSALVLNIKQALLNFLNKLYFSLILAGGALFR